MADELKMKIIDLLQPEISLWNMRSNVYKGTKNTVLKKKWDDIGRQVNSDGETVKGIWRNLRVQFTRELKKCLKRHSGDAGPDGDNDLNYTGAWNFFPHLLFLCDTVMPRATESNLPADVPEISVVNSQENSNDGIPEVPGVEYIEEINVDFQEDVYHSGVETSDNTGKGSSVSSSSTRDSLPRRQTLASLKERQLALEEQKVQLYKEKQANKRSVDSDDPDLLFLKSLLPELKKARQKLKLRTKIMNVISDFLEDESSTVEGND